MLACVSRVPTSAPGLPEAPSTVAAPKPEPPAAPAPLPPLEVPEGRFATLEPGLEMAMFVSDVAHPVGDGRIAVVRVDPTHFDVVLHTASDSPQGRFMTAEAWADAHDLVVAFNPSMYHADGASVFFMRSGQHINQPDRHPNAGNVLVLGPTSSSVKAVDVVDLNCGMSFEQVLTHYASVVQSYRLLDCQRRPTWKVNPKVWSHAVYGIDGEGRLLFIHARTPWNTRVFTDIVLALPLDAKHLMYGEGGPEASMVVRSKQGGFARWGALRPASWSRTTTKNFGPSPTF